MHPVKKGSGYARLLFCPILDKKYPPKDKKSPDPSEPLSKAIPSTAVTLKPCAEVTI